LKSSMKSRMYLDESFPVTTSPLNPEKFAFLILSNLLTDCRNFLSIPTPFSIW